MISTSFRISEQIMIEYIYNYVQYNTLQFPFRKIKNNYNNSLIINSRNSAYNIIRNVTDFTAVEIDSNKEASLGDDTTYFYPNVDSNIVDSNLTFSPQKNVTYDAVRIHLLTGYNFDDYQGILCDLYLKTKKNRVLSLARHVSLKSDTRNLFFAPIPKKISADVFDKYYEFLIPSTDKMIQEQIASPTDANGLAYKFSEGDLIDESNTIYCQTSMITNVDEVNGSEFFLIETGKKFAFSAVDEFSLLSASITENSKGYFEYCAKWNLQLIEDFIFQLNSIPGNSYFIIHQLDFYEQVGPNNILVDSMSIVQNSDYDKVKKVKPILVNGSNVVTFSVDYTLRLYNNINGTSIVKSSTITSLNPTLYSENGLKLNVGNVTEPVKVYNKVFKNDITVTTDVLPALKTKIVYSYADNNQLTIGGTTEIKVSPFDNIFRFAIERVNNKEAFELDTISNYYLVFINTDLTKLYIPELLSAATKKNQGELMFKLSEENAKKVLNLTDNNFYIVAKSPNAINTVIVGGTWTKFKPNKTPELTATQLNSEVLNTETLTLNNTIQSNNNTLTLNQNDGLTK